MFKCTAVFRQKLNEETYHFDLVDPRNNFIVGYIVVNRVTKKDVISSSEELDAIQRNEIFQSALEQANLIKDVEG